MSVITITHKGNFRNTERFLNRMSKGDIFNTLSSYGARGVAALASATPVDTGLTASSWTYSVDQSRGTHSIIWENTNVITGTPVVIWLQFGHGTGTGGYVAGRDFINPAIKPIFDDIANSVWREVTSA